jgi:hypothetical protein
LNILGGDLPDLHLGEGHQLDAKSIEMMEERSADVGEFKTGSEDETTLPSDGARVCIARGHAVHQEDTELEGKSLKDRVGLKLSTMGRLDFHSPSPTVVFLPSW